MDTKIEIDDSPQFITILDLELRSGGSDKDHWGIYQRGTEVTFGIMGESWFFVASLNELYERAHILFGEYDPSSMYFMYKVTKDGDFACCLTDMATADDYTQNRINKETPMLLN